MEILLTWGKYILVAISVVGVAVPLFAGCGHFHTVWSVWRRFRVRMCFECLGIITVLLTAIYILLWLIPGLKFGWINLFFDGEAGHMNLKPILEGTESDNALVRILVLIFLVAVAFVLPFWARFEEDYFRKGYNDLRSIVKQSIKFGLMHCMAGVPVGAGIALIIPGMFFALKYKNALERNLQLMDYKAAEEEAIMTSTTYHTIYNMIVLSFIVIAAISAI